MKYLLLWSGDIFGMKKKQIPAVENAGIIGHWRGGKCLVPDYFALYAALPVRYRGMLGRAMQSGGVWFDKFRDNAPVTIHLCDTRGNYRHTLYMQPLDGESNQ